MTDQRPYWQVIVSLAFSLLATAAFVLIGVKAIGFFMPFVVGWVLSVIASPLVNWLDKRLKIVKNLGTALIAIVVLGIIVSVLYFAVSKLAEEIGELLNNFPAIYGQLEEGMQKIGDELSGIFQRLPKGIQRGWNTILLNMDEYMGNFVTRISEPTVAAAGNFAKKLPSYLIAFVVSLMSAYFFTVQREDVVSFLKKISPKPVEKRMSLVADSLKYAVGGYFKAQFKIMGIIFVILLISLMILKIKYSVLIAFLISFLDFLPFFGTGTALIPWAVYELFMGEYKIALTLFVTYGVTQLLRQMVQPKLVGESMGLNPLVTLILIYTGYKLKGVIGMVIAVPFGMVLIHMCQAGAFDYITDDVKTLVSGIMKLRKKS